MSDEDLKISAIIPTRGDVDLTGIKENLSSYPEIGEILTPVGRTPWNRYDYAIRLAKYGSIYVQDDDCITDIRPLIEAYIPGEGIMINAMTRQHASQYPGRFTLIGFGALFDREMLSVFDDYERDSLFYRESDRIMGSVPYRSVFPRITILPCAFASNRLYRQAEHNWARRKMEKRILDHDKAASDRESPKLVPSPETT